MSFSLHVEYIIHTTPHIHTHSHFVKWRDVHVFVMFFRVIKITKRYICKKELFSGNMCMILKLSLFFLTAHCSVYISIHTVIQVKKAFKNNKKSNALVQRDFTVFDSKYVFTYEVDLYSVLPSLTSNLMLFFLLSWCSSLP